MLAEKYFSTFEVVGHSVRLIKLPTGMSGNFCVCFFAQLFLV